jgi:hypothetical protein
MNCRKFFYETTFCFLDTETDWLSQGEILLPAGIVAPVMPGRVTGELSALQHTCG